MLNMQRRKAMKTFALLGSGMALFPALEAQAKMLEKMFQDGMKSLMLLLSAAVLLVVLQWYL